MPNWCANTLTLKHEDPAMITRARDAFMRGELLQEFIPCPAELLETTAQFGQNDQEKLNREKYGYGSWYDWNIAHWGTKWDVGGDGCDALHHANEFNASFDSAWAPPTSAYERLMELGFEVRAMYYEPGMAFAGIWEDGFDDCYQYGSMNAEQIADALPEELDEAFGISESVAEWEAEQAEEE